jgi:hypothetical protein
MEERKISKKPIITMVKSRKFHVFLREFFIIKKSVKRDDITRSPSAFCLTLYNIGWTEPITQCLFKFIHGVLITSGENIKKHEVTVHPDPELKMVISSL